MFPKLLLKEAESLLAACHARKATIATAESCTGGLIAGLLTEIAGSSRVVERGFVTYSNSAKEQMLGVHWELLAKHGAVSAEVAAAMAEGARTHSGATLAVSVTGIAGPGGATPGKEVGLVFIGAAKANAEVIVEKHQFSGNRHEVRLAAVKAALNLLYVQLLSASV